MDADTVNASSVIITSPLLPNGSELVLPSVPGVQLLEESTLFQQRITYSGNQPFSVYMQLLSQLQFFSSQDEPEAQSIEFSISISSLGDSGDLLYSNTATAIVTIMVVNDNHPVFSEAMYHGAVEENVPPGTVVDIAIAATDDDIFGNTNITYHIDGTNQDFSVEPLTGIITTLRSFDADQSNRSIIQFQLIAADNDGPSSLSSSVTVIIEITDVNDNIPTFSESPYHISILESAVVGSFVFQITAQDDDISETNSMITYQIQSLDSGSAMDNLTLLVPFQIDPNSGVISLDGELDFEATQEITFTVVATDSGLPPQTGSVEVIVAVEDSNDNSPVFVDAPYSITVSEDEPVNITILVASAFDADSGSNGEITFSLSHTFQFSVASINHNTVTVILVSPLDYEIEPVINFTLTATDGGSEPQLAIEHVTVTVLNVNDNSPVFDSTLYQFSVPEGSRLEEQIAASDPDGDHITYTLGPEFESIFELNATSGVLRSVEGFQFDFESQQQYSGLAHAFDGMFNTSTTLVVDVIDENDNPPHFTRDIYTVSVPENTTTNTAVVIVAATDADSGSNAAITYNISSGNPAGVFSINPQTGVVSVANRLDFDLGPVSYNLTVVAQNTAPPYHSDQAYILITLTNIDDIAPVLTVNALLVDFIENSDPVHVAPTLAITDDDTQAAPITQCSVAFEACPDEAGPDCLLDAGEHLALNESLLTEGLEFTSFGPHPSNGSQHLVVSGNSLKQTYESILRSLLYVNLAPEPRPGKRVVIIQCFNGNFYSNELRIVVNVRLVDEFCVEISTTASYFNYTEGMGQLDIGELAAFDLVDFDHTPHNTVSGVRVTLERIDGDSEVLSVTTTSGLDFSESTGSGDLPFNMDVAGDAGIEFYTLLMSGRANISSYMQVLRSLTYTNDHSEPSPGDRHLSITPLDDTLNCSSLQLLISVVPSNDNPPMLLLNTSQPLLYMEESGALDFAAQVDLQIMDTDHNDLFPMEGAIAVLDGVADAGMEQLNFSPHLLPSTVSMTGGRSV